MEFLLFIGAVVGFVLLEKRVSALENTVAALREQMQSPSHAVRDSTPELQPAPPKSSPPPRAKAQSIAPPVKRATAPLEAPAVAYIPDPAKAQPAPPIFRLSPNFEDIFGRLLPIWAGGITLAVAGFFLVRYSIEQGMLTPTVRVVLSFLFGGALIAGAELANRFAERVTDPRVAQALAGAGLATLYASFYLAGSGYGLIGSTLAFIGLAGVTAGAIVLSYRFGLPSAVLGLVGGFAAPMLAGGEEANVPLLATYLGLVTAGLVLTGQRQQRAWMGIVALFFGLGWGALLLLTGSPSAGDAIAIGGYLVLLGAVIPALAGRVFSNAIIRLVAGGLATIQMAVLVAQGDFTLLAWSLFALLSAALAFLGWREARMREGSAIAALTGLLLLADWPAPATGQFMLVAATLTVIFAVVPLGHLWRGQAKHIDLAMICAFPPGMLAAVYWQFGEPSFEGSELALAAIAAALAAFPAAAAWREWFKGEAAWKTLAPLTSAAVLLTAAGVLALPWWFAPIIGVAVVAVLTKLLAGHNGRGERALVWSVAGFALLALIGSLEFFDEAAMLSGWKEDPDILRAVMRWSAAAAAFALVAWRETLGWAARIAEALTAVLVYGALAQFVPADALAWTAALAALAVAWWLTERNGARVMLLAITGLWALLSLGQWLYVGGLGLAGEAVLVSDLPSWREALRMVLPLAAAFAAFGLVRSDGVRFRKAALVALPVAGVVLHVLYKQVFAIGDADQFIALGLAERTIWQALLAGVAIALLKWQGGSGIARQAAIGFAATALLHFGWFTLMLHNPLLSNQVVGPWPIVNWLLPAYGIAIALLAVLCAPAAERFALLRPVFDGAIMVLVSLLALSELRHAFAGSILTATPIGQSEDLLRSLLGIVLAAGFLWWGSRTGERSWRIGSLVLMLLAVAKVFVFDAAGLEGLARIASFMALGFSLIGIGWFYNRQLRGGAPEKVEA